MKRLSKETCAGVLIDVQEFFLDALPKEERARIEARTAQFLGLLTHLGCPLIATVERPLAEKGALPASLLAHAKEPPVVLEKDFFDLSREREIADALSGLGRKQLVLAGCETDVCVLQSCLGLLEKGYDVFVVEDLVFSSSPNAAAALERMRAAGAVLLSYKTLFHELLQAVEGSAPRKAVAGKEFPPALDQFGFD